MFQLRTCLECGYEWKSNDKSQRPQCSQCKSTHSMLSKDIPPHLKFKKEFDELKAELTDLKTMLNTFLESHKRDHIQLTNFELQATHDIKDLIFWKGKFRERTDPKKPKSSMSFDNPESELKIVHRKTLPPKPSRNIHDWYPGEINI